MAARQGAVHPQYNKEGPQQATRGPSGALESEGLLSTGTACTAPTPACTACCAGPITTTCCGGRAGGQGDAGRKACREREQGCCTDVMWLVPRLCAGCTEVLLEAAPELFPVPNKGPCGLDGYRPQSLPMLPRVHEPDLGPPEHELVAGQQPMHGPSKHRCWLDDWTVQVLVHRAAREVVLPPLPCLLSSSRIRVTSLLFSSMALSSSQLTCGFCQALRHCGHSLGPVHLMKHLWQMAWHPRSLRVRGASRGAVQKAQALLLTVNRLHLGQPVALSQLLQECAQQLDRRSVQSQLLLVRILLWPRCVTSHAPRAKRLGL